MSKFTIYNKNGVVLHESITEYNSDGEQVWADSLEYSGSWMGECFLTITVKSAYPIDFHVGDYIDYRGERFTLNYDPAVIKKARRGSYGEGFTYDSIKFNARHTELTEVRFLDYVLYDNELHYTSLPEFPFYAASIDDYCDRLQANTNRWCADNGFAAADYWQFVTPSLDRTKQRLQTTGITAAQATEIWNAAYGERTETSEEKTEISVSVSRESIWDALSRIKNDFGLNFINRDRKVIIGSAGLPTNKIFRYGKGNGLYEIERNADTEQQIVTKLFAYGSGNNMPVRYYENIRYTYFAHVETLVSNYGNTGLHYAVFLLDLDFKNSFFTNRSVSYPGGYNGAYNYIVEVTANDITVKGYVTKNSNSDRCYVYCEYTGVNPEDDRDETDESKMNAFSEAIKQGDKVIFAAGIDKKEWPTDYRENTASELPNNMAVSKLMLPGFPSMSLYDWVIANGGAAVADDDNTDKYGRATWTYNGTTHEAFFSKEQYNPYILSLNFKELGMRELSKVFDGSDDTDDIHPTIEGATYNGHRIDEIAAAEMIKDNGVFESGENEPYVTLTLPNMGSEFLLDELAAEGTQDGGTPTISMKDGYCGARQFQFESGNVKQNSNDTWEVKAKREFDDLLNLYFPYSYHVAQGGSAMADEPYQVVAGDHYVLTGIPMSGTYIALASQQLLEQSLIFLAKNDYTRYTYIPKVDELFMARQHDAYIANPQVEERSLYLSIKEGDILHFNDDDLSIADALIFIDQLTIKENGNETIPTYELTLRNDKAVGTIQRIENKIDSLTSGTGSGGGVGGTTINQLRTLINSYGGDRFLSKISDDIAAGRITFEQGLISLANAIFGNYLRGETNSGAAILPNGTGDFLNLKVIQKVLGNLTVEQTMEAVGMIFKTFLKSPGAGPLQSDTGIYMDANTGVISTDGLMVRGWAYFEKLVYNIQEIMAIDYAFTGGGDIEEVKDNGDGTYTLYMHKEKEGKHPEIAEHDILYGKTNDDAVSGTSYEYYTSWMRVADNGVTFKDGMERDEIVVGLWPDNAVPGGKNFPPKAMMSVSHRGNTTNNLRQSFWVLSGTDHNLTHYWNVTQPIMTADNYAACLGILPAILDRYLPSTRNPLKPSLFIHSLYYAYAKKIFWPARINKEDRGDWTATPTAYYDEEMNSGTWNPTDGSLSDESIAQALADGKIRESDVDILKALRTWGGTVTAGTEISEPYHFRSITRAVWFHNRLASAWSSESDLTLYRKMTQEFTDDVDLETSRVWSGGRLWEAMVDNPTDEPSETSVQWQLITDATGTPGAPGKDGRDASLAYCMPEVVSIPTDKDGKVLGDFSQEVNIYIRTSGGDLSASNISIKDGGDNITLMDGGFVGHEDGAITFNNETAIIANGAFSGETLVMEDYSATLVSARVLVTAKKGDVLNEHTCQFNVSGVDSDLVTYAAIAQLNLVRSVWGEGGNSPVNVYTWSQSNTDAPAISGTAYPPAGWTKRITDQPGDDYFLWMAESVMHADGTIDAWGIPVCLSGEDGDPGADASDQEFIYLRLDTYPFPTTQTKPANINVGEVSPEGTANGTETDKQKNDWVPNGWSDRALPAEENNKYVYESQRRKSAGNNQQWGAFTEPYLRSNWGVRGVDGDGVQYVFKLFDHELTDAERTSNIPTKPASQNANGEWIPTGWSDDPQSPTKAMPFCYCSTIREINGTWGTFSKLGLWSTFTESITKKSETAYYIKNSTGTRPAENDPSWSTTKPTLNAGEWLFTKTVITWSDDSTTILYTDERNPNDGVAGQDIVNGTTAITYCVSDSNTSQPADSSFKPYAQIVSQIQQGKWLWSKATTPYYKANDLTTPIGSSSNYSVSYISKDGQDGKSVQYDSEHSSVQYAISAYGTPGTGRDYPSDITSWSNTVPAPQKGKFLWTKDVTAYDNDGTIEYSTTYGVSYYGTDGTNVTVDTDNSKTEYAVSNQGTSSSSVTGWSTNIPTVGQGQYLWTRVTTAFSDGNSTVSYGVSYNAEDGTDGTSVTISSKSVTYAITQNGTQPADSAFTYTELPPLSLGDYLWTKTEVNYSDGNSTKSYNVSRLGTDGANGQPGTNGTTTHFAYATSNDGQQNFSTSPFVGATFIGTYTDTTQADSTDYRDYTWTQWRGDDGDSVEIDTARTYVRYSTVKTASKPADITFTLTEPPTLGQGDYLWILSQTAYVGVSDPLKSYSVSRVGTDGSNGDPGADGYTTHFAYATSADGSQGFSTTSFVGATYIGTYRDQQAVDSTNYRDYVWTQWRGNDGQNGRALTASSEHYKASALSTGEIAPTSDANEWTTNPNVPDAQGNTQWNESKKYLWNYERIEYTESDGTVTVSRTTPRVIAIWTKDGAVGRGIDSIVNYYAVSASADTAPVSGWDDNPVAPTEEAPYLWNYERINWTTGTPSYTDTDPHVIGHYGADGDDVAVAVCMPAVVSIPTDRNGVVLEDFDATVAVQIYTASEDLGGANVTIDAGDTNVTIENGSVISRTDNGITFSGEKAIVSNGEFQGETLVLDDSDVVISSGALRITAKKGSTLTEHVCELTVSGYDTANTRYTAKTSLNIQRNVKGNGIEQTDRTYNISAQATTASDATAPSDITTWLTQSPAVTEEKPYLWMREITTYTDKTVITRYLIQGAMGQNGIDAQDCEWVYVRTTENVAPTIVDDGTDGYLSDDFLPLAKVTSGRINGGTEGDANVNVRCTDDPKGVDSTWRYEWEIKRTKGNADGNGHRSWQKYSGTMTIHNNFVENGVRIDLDNQADLVSLDSDGKVRFARAITTHARIYDGSAVATTGVTNTTTDSLVIGGCTPTVSLANGILTITWAFTKGMAAAVADKTIKLTYKNTEYQAKFSLGTTDRDAIWQVMPKPSEVSFARNTTTNALTPDSQVLKCGYTKATGSGTESVDEAVTASGQITHNGKASGMYLYYRQRTNNTWGTTWTAYPSAGITVANSTTVQDYEFCITNGPIANDESNIEDREGVPVMKDGAEGDGIVSVTRTYGISAQSTTANDTTAPSDITEWAASSPAVTEAKPYLWAREVVDYKFKADTIKYYMIGAMGQNGIDAQDVEWVFIRTKTNIAPVISGDDTYTDHNNKTYTADDHLPKVVAGTGGSLSDIESDNSGSASKLYECTDDPKGVDSTWKYEWEIKREKGAADANGHRAWQAYSGTMTLHNQMPVSISSANVWYALSDSGTTAPADSVFDDAQTGFDDFPPLNSGKYIWQATKITDSNGATSYTGKMCLGPTTDFLEGTEVYAVSASNSQTPTSWATTYNKEKGKYLWTATRVKYANKTTYDYLNPKCIGYFGEDGDLGKDAPQVLFDPATLFIPCDSDGTYPLVDDETYTVNVSANVQGTAISISSLTIDSFPSGITSVTKQSNTQIKVRVVNTGFGISSPEGNIVLSLVGTANGKTYTFIGLLPVAKTYQGEQGESGQSIQGKMGRFLWYAGLMSEFNNDSVFTADDYQAPYVNINTEDSPQCFAYVGSNVQNHAFPSQPSEYTESNGWKEMTTDFEYLITKAVFTSYASLGGFIINEDYFLSRYGTLVASDGTETIVNGSNLASQYRYFCPADPMAENTSVGTYPKFRPTKCINALTGEEWSASGNVHTTPSGDVTMQNATVRGTLMYKRIKTMRAEQYVSNTVNLYCWDETTLRLLYDTIMIYGVYYSGRSFTIYLPPASVCVGATVEICNMTSDYTNLQIQNSTVNIYVQGDIDEGATYVVWGSDDSRYYTNRFCLPFKYEDLYGNFENIPMHSHKKITLVAAECPKRFAAQDTTTYVWLMIDAQ